MKNSFRTLILTNKDITRLVDIKKSIGVVEKAFKAYALSKIQMPSKIYLPLGKYEGDFRAMPAYIQSMDAAAVKWVNVHPHNKKYNLPTVMGELVLSDPRNGFPLSIMDATLLTSFRTAAAGAVAAKYLARKDSKVLGLVGCGEQAKTQLQALRTLFAFKQVKVWGHQLKLSQSFVKGLRNKNEEMIAVKSVSDCVKDADIIITTTPSRKPLVQLKWLKPGVHINAIGADAKGKIELEPLILRNAKVIIDDWAQASHSGEINVALARKVINKRSIYGTLGDIVIGKKKGRISQKEITVFDSTGLAIQDVALAQLIYQTALKKKLGKTLQFI